MATKYSLEIRSGAIEMYLSGSTAQQVVEAFRIGSTTTLERWIDAYRSSDSGGADPRKRFGFRHSDSTRRRFAAAIDDGVGYESASRLAGVPFSTGWNWLQRYRRKGPLWLAPVTSPRIYSKELKLAAVRAFMAGSTRAEVVAAFEIDSSRSFEHWVANFRRHGAAVFDHLPAEITIQQLKVEHAALSVIVERLDPSLPTQAKVALVASLADRYPVRALLRAIGLPKSTYYYRRSRLVRPDRYVEVRPLIRQSFDRAYQAYGYRRVRAHLSAVHGLAVSGKTVRRLMREEGCVCRSRRRRTKAANQGSVNQIAPNVLERDFSATAPNQKWVTDVTQFVVAGQLLYLSPITDLFNGEVLSYTVSRNPTMPLVLDMMKSALSQLGPDRPIVHSDQGWQYQHASYRKMLAEHGLTQSMSRKGNCHDNAPAESLFSHIKQEFIRRREFRSIEQFTLELDKYVHWYNNDRIKERLGWRSPVAFRIEHNALAISHNEQHGSSRPTD